MLEDEIKAKVGSREFVDIESIDRKDVRTKQ
jgi:hypothetical protein